LTRLRLATTVVVTPGSLIPSTTVPTQEKEFGGVQLWRVRSAPTALGELKPF
jgi:hypothetical protein